MLKLIRGDNMEDFTKLAKEAIKNDKGFIGNNNYEVIKVEKNYCELDGIITQSSLNNLGIAHGGYIFGLADTAAGIAAMTNGGNVVTVDSNINYIKPAKGERITAKATAIKIGKVINVFDVQITDEKEEVIAKATITFYNVEK
jgi:acyl-CoA thioesterase